MASAEGVRFSDNTREYEPEQDDDRGVVSPEMENQIRDISMTLQKSRLQASRMENFAFEPVSLPPSRVPSPSASGTGSRQQSGHASPALAPRGGSMGQVHPLTPPASKTGQGPQFVPRLPEATVVTPQRSPSREWRRKSGDIATTSSREASPHSSSRLAPPKEHRPSGHVSPEMGSRRSSFTPPGESKDPKDSKDSKESKQTEKQSGGIFGSKRHHVDDDSHEKKDSMKDLKRFFHLGSSKNKEKPSKADSESKTSTRSTKSSKSGQKTPPMQSRNSSVSALPFADDHGLQSKYGKFGKVLGSGAGGSVRLMKRSSDGVTFAVKEFRARHNYETEKEYNKKVTAEFCIGSTLHHGNIIETMDIIHEKGSWYEVMEYAPFDLFATVMTGRMSREEVTCCTMQILAGVSYLHSMGLAHRDLKLDNVVISEHGIMKLIDFGSAVVFRYPFENDVVKATGIVGSDPYLAPEVYDSQRYDPRAVDIWSLAIIYCCMSLRRFPWKAPRLSDVSYKLFVSEATPGAPGPEVLRRPSGGRTTAPDVMSRDESMTAADARPSSKDKQQSSGDGDRKDTQAGVIKGPWRLLRLLPRDSRYIIGRMLEVDPSKRATLEEVHADKWVARALHCRQVEGGRVIRAEGHSHTLEPGAAQPDKK